MSEQSPFNRQHIDQSAAVPVPGLLEQLGLPPRLIKVPPKKPADNLDC